MCLASTCAVMQCAHVIRTAAPVFQSLLANALGNTKQLAHSGTYVKPSPVEACNSINTNTQLGDVYVVRNKRASDLSLFAAAKAQHEDKNP